MFIVCGIKSIYGLCYTGGIYAGCYGYDTGFPRGEDIIAGSKVGYGAVTGAGAVGVSITFSMFDTGGDGCPYIGYSTDEPSNPKGSGCAGG